MDRLFIFDTTLRDGEQSPGASMTRGEKLRIAKALERLRVDVIEAGFAIASEDDYQAIRRISELVRGSTICSLARALDKDIERAASALESANRARIHTFIATSPIHMKYKLQMEPDRVIDQAIRAVQKARRYTEDVEFSCEDAGRSEPAFLRRIIQAAIEAGATTINIPDTVGYAIPEAFGATVGDLISSIPGSDQVVFSVHCHNDLGLAVANSLAAVGHGARQVECTVNGLGERAGNASLEEIVMAVRTRADYFGLETGIDTTQIVPASRLVSSITGFPVQPNKAIVGANAFAHESGIHQDGVLKHRETYEIMKAEDVGWRANSLVLGKHSGRNAVRTRLEALGYQFDQPADLDACFSRFKELADKKHEIFDEDLHSIAGNTGQSSVLGGFELDHLAVASETGTRPEAHLRLRRESSLLNGSASGSGPVDATFKAIESIVQSGANLQLYSVNAITSGTDSQGEVTVRLEKNGQIVNGTGADTDIVIASALAYLDGINLLSSRIERQHPQKGMEAL